MNLFRIAVPSVFQTLAVASLLAVGPGLPAGRAAETPTPPPPAPRPEFWRQESGGRDGQARNAARENPLDRVEATEEQRAALREVMRQIQADSRETAGRLRQARQGLTDAVFAEKPDEARIRERAAEVGRLEGEIACVRARHLAAARPRLSPAQLEFLHNARGEVAARLQERVQSGTDRPSRPNRRPAPKPAGNP